MTYLALLFVPMFIGATIATAIMVFSDFPAWVGRLFRKGKSFR